MSNTSPAAPVALIMGSQSDWPTMRHAAEKLDELGVAYAAKIVSAHRTPDRMVAFAKGAADAGHKVIIAGGELDVGSDELFVDEVWIYDSQTGKITQGPSLPDIRTNGAMIKEEITGAILYLGGTKFGATTTVYRLPSDNADQWEDLGYVLNNDRTGFEILTPEGLTSTNCNLVVEY